MQDPMHHEQRIPALSGFDSTLRFLREGYAFIGNRCAELASDTFTTRLMLRPVTCLRGAEAADVFYHPGRMTRKGAMARSVVSLLQDRGSVQGLDGRAHHIRKAMFLELMTPERLDLARGVLAEEWAAAMRDWQGRTIALRDALPEVMTRTALRWCGIPPEHEDVPKRAEELSAMIEAAGSIGPAYLRALRLRHRSETWARRQIRKARTGHIRDGALGRLAHHEDADGSHLSDAVAAVELLNLLRPIVAVGRYIVFAAHALHVHSMTVKPFLASNEAEGARAVGEEVRRLYPFFPVIGGKVRAPFDWRGRSFRAGDWLVLDLYGTCRDGAVWAKPETFDPARHLAPDRPDHAMVPQGGGELATGHRCPGEHLSAALLTEAIGLLGAMTYDVPEQDLRIPLDQFPTWPRDGMKISVARDEAILPAHLRLGLGQKNRARLPESRSRKA